MQDSKNFNIKEEQEKAKLNKMRAEAKKAEEEVLHEQDRREKTQEEIKKMKDFKINEHAKVGSTVIKTIFDCVLTAFKCKEIDQKIESNK